jgi:hypothetical protein
VKVKVKKASGETSEDLTPESLKEALLLRANEIVEIYGVHSDMIIIENFTEVTGITPQAGEVHRPSPETGAMPSDPVAKKLNRWEVRMIQAALCLPGDQIDGIWGRRTAAALQLFQKGSNISPADGRLTEDQLKTLLEMKGNEVARHCGPPGPVADQLTRQQIMSIQLALCHMGPQIDGLWGSATKDALRRYQLRIGAAPTDGILTAEQRDTLLDFSGAEIALSCSD